VLLCTSCSYCLRPGREVWVRHLRQALYLLQRASLKALVELFASYVLRAAEAEPGRLPTEAISGLRLLDGFQCCTCAAHFTRDCKAMQCHVSKAHQQKPAVYKKSLLWRECKLQTFFAENRWVRYFIINRATGAINAGTKSLNLKEADFFRQLDKDAAVAEEDAKAKANIVYSFDRYRSAVMPWLIWIGIEKYI
jgi:hypothetical protein